jgi:hypothetical protein
MDYMTPNSYAQMRRLLVSASTGDDDDPRNPPHPIFINVTASLDLLTRVAQFANINELSLSGLAGPLVLHHLNTGLTRLYMKNVTTSAQHLLSMALRGPTLSSGDHGTSPLMELGLAMVRLDSINHEGRVSGTMPPPPPLPSCPTSHYHHPYTKPSDLKIDAGTWQYVFETIANRCPLLRVLFTQNYLYTSEMYLQMDDVAACHYADNMELERLARQVLTRPGAEVTGLRVHWGFSLLT